MNDFHTAINHLTTETWWLGELQWLPSSPKMWELTTLLVPHVWANYTKTTLLHKLTEIMKNQLYFLV